MSISKKIIISAFAAAVIFSLMILASESTESREPTTQPSQPEISAKQEQYRVRAHNGKIAVFVDGNDKPLYVLDTPSLHELPEYDQNILNDGIVAENNTELLKILEDYDN